MSDLLLNEHPLIILPSLAVKVGLNEAIFLQQLHYWLLKSNHVIDGEKWVYNSIPMWQEQFPFWSKETTRRIIRNLEDRDVLISGCFNSLKIDKTKWYRINYAKLSILEPSGEITRSSGQFDLTIGSNCGDHRVNLTSPLPETTTEITTETTTENKTITSANAEIDKNECTCTTFGKCKVCRPTTDEVKQVFDYWVVRTGRAKPVLGEKRRAKIVRALKNYSVEKLKTAIDGCMKSPYHQGDNETGTKYDDLELILRNETKIEFFIAKAQQAVVPPDSIYKPNPIFNGAINYNQSRRQS